MAEAEAAIKGRLETQVSNLASATSIWAVLAPSTATRPYLTFEVLNESPTSVMGADTTPTECYFQVSIFADTFLEIVNITDDVRAALTRYSGTTNSVVVQDIFYEQRNDVFTEQELTYQRVLDFRMYYEE